MLAKKMSLKVRYIGSKKEVPATEKSDKSKEVEVEDCLCRGTVVILKDESESNHMYVILAPFDKKVSNKYFLSLDCPKVNPPPADTSAKKNTEEKKKKTTGPPPGDTSGKKNTVEKKKNTTGKKKVTRKGDDIKLHIRMVEVRKQGVLYKYKFIDSMKDSTSMLKCIWRNDVKKIIGKMTDMCDK